MNKGQRTAARILDAAEELFAQRGYAATSLRDIAAATGIQQPGLYKYFASKDELYRAVYEQSLRPFVAVLDEVVRQPGEAATFAALTDRLIDYLAVRPNIARLLVSAILRPVDEVDPVAMEWLDRLVQCGKAINDRAGVRSEPDLLFLHIISVFHLVFGYFASDAAMAALTGRPAADPHLVALHKGVVNAFVHSLAPAAVR